MNISDVISLDDNYYISPQVLDLSSYPSKSRAYYCPIKKWYVGSSHGRVCEPLSKEAFWVYEQVENASCQHIVGWAVTCQIDMNNGLSVQQSSQ